MSKNTGKEYELLNYRDGLDNVAKLRYDQKCTIINGVDPYNVSAHTLTWSKDVNKLPCVMYPDICNYLIHTPGQYTYDDLKAWRSLDAVNQLHNGWVSDRAAIVFDESVLVTAKVMHSQRLREKPLQPWVITEPEGPIKAAHCNCMAGLGEACTHIAALLWSINATVALRDSATVTDKKAYWMLPTSRKTVQYKEVSKINFTSTKSAKKKFGDIIEGHSIATQGTVTPKTPVSRKKIPRANYEDLIVLCEKMNKLKVKPAILALVPPYANEFRPKTDTKNFPQALNDLKDTDCISASVEKVKEVCSKIDIHCSVEQACIVEEETRLQSKNKLWYKFRAGRITASRAKSVCATDSESPAPSIIKGICYPDSYKFQNSATRYGLDNEKRARDKFLDVMAEHHEKLLVEDSGFHISTVHPFIGASPDGIVHCDCCGTACLEIKCPYSAEDKDVDHNTCECLTEKDGLVQLKTTHPYYYQVQAQLGVTGHDFAYFVVWSSCAIHIEIINFNSIVWKEICEKSRLVFYNGVLPELVGKVFTRLPISKKPVVETAQHNDSTSNSDTVASSNSQDSMPSSSNSEAKENKQEDPKGPAKKMRGKKSLKKKSVLKSSDNFPMTSDEILYCVCEQVEFGRMVACDNIECPGEWFHYGCVNLENAPEGKWYCPDCRKLPAFKRKRSIRN